MRIKSSNILVIGDVMIDEYIMGGHHRQSPEADCPILNYERKELRLGGAANVALNLLNLRQKTSLLSVTGDDEIGKHISKICHTKGINFINVIDRNRPTTRKTRYVDTSFKQLLRVDRESTEYIGDKASDSLIKQIRALSQKDLELIIIQDYNKGVLNPTVIQAIQYYCQKYSIKLCVDPKFDNFKLLSKCDLFKPNLKEIEYQYGKKIQVDSESLKTVTSDLELNKPKQIFITLADKGIYFQNRNEYNVIKGINVNGADVSGAGDTVISVLAILLQSDVKTIDMAKIANKCGANVCNKQGVSQLDYNDFQRIINMKT